MYNFQARMPTLSQLKVRAEELQLDLSLEETQGLSPKTKEISLSFRLLSIIRKFSGILLDRILNKAWVSKYFTADLPVLQIGLSLSLLHRAVPSHMIA